MVDIAGATSPTYTLTSADTGQIISVKVTATNSAGSANATSLPTAQITSLPANTALPVIGGTPLVGNTLTTTDGTWTGSPVPAYTYQWKRGGTNISGATANSYVLVTADIGATITVTVTGTNSAGSASATSAAVGPVSGPGVWSILPIGGSGALSGIDVHADGTRALRADSGGAYRWNTASGIWEPIITAATMPTLDATPGSLLGVFELRIAPSNSSRWWMHYSGYIFRSDNKGSTWVNTTRGNATFPQTVFWYNEANDKRRGDGPKLAIDPQNPDVVIVCTVANAGKAAFYTLDAGASWVALPGVPAAVTDDQGESGTGMCVAYDPSSLVGGTGGNKKLGAYIFSYGNGVYRTTTGPNGTWTLVPSTPARAYTAIAIAADGKVFFPNRETANLVNNNTLDIYSGSAWSTVTTGSVADTTGVAVNPSNAAQVWAVDRNGAVSYSANHGVSWTGDAGGWTFTTSDIPWPNNTYGNSTALYINGTSFAFDPSNGKLWGGYGLGVLTGPAITTAVNMPWVSATVAIEESISTDIIKPPGGRPVMTIQDQGVFRSPAPNVYPSVKGVTNNYHAGWAVDYCPSPGNTNVIVARIYEDTNDTAHPTNRPNESGKSIDGGQTWTRFTNVPATDNKGGMIACGTDPNNYVIIASDNGTASMPPYYTTDGGITWNAISISGVSSTGPTGWNDNWYSRRHILCSDRVTPDTFYMYNYGPSGSLPGVYKSSNKGVSWTRIKPSIFNQGPNIFASRLVSVPGQAGNLFFTQGWAGTVSPERSVDGGVNWTTVSNIGEVWAIGFGKAVAGGYPAIFMAGYNVARTISGIWQSDDNAANWTLVPGSTAPLGSLDVFTYVVGDMDVYGDCYLGLTASGFMFYKS
jgi:hypothetical protein